MKKIILSAILALVATVAIQAKQIAVVSADGSTSVHGTLQAAIEAASDGSVVYLPGGGFPIADSVVITKRLTIIGIGHKVKTDNADGNTTITGNLFFEKGSDGSAVMGAYITGDVHIGNDGNEVDNVLVRYCNLNAIHVQNATCLGTVVNQNYIRGTSTFNGAGAEFTNNIAHSLTTMQNGTIENNIFVSHHANYALHTVHYTSIKNNVFMEWIWGPHYGSHCQATNNMAYGNFGDDPVNISGYGKNDIFVSHAGITPASDYHFKGDFEKYNATCGIYAGTGFSDSALPPIPYIVSKQIPEQTDANGKLNIKISVRAGE